MDLVDKLNRWVLSRLRKQAVLEVETNDEGIDLLNAGGRRSIPWAAIQEIAAVRQPHLAIGSVALAIRETDSTASVVDDTALGFVELCESLTRRLPAAIPYEKWIAELTAQPGESGQIIFDRAKT